MELTQQQIDRVVTANTFENKKKEMGSNHPVYRKGETVGIYIVVKELGLCFLGVMALHYHTEVSALCNNIKR